jgi:hypothetical protein
MFLINIRELRLEEFVGDYNIPQYFILSHTWGDDELTFQDVRNLPRKALMHRKGWRKINGFCQMLLKSKDWLASDDGFYRTIRYVWVDTCCINKESSAELSEAINSMYRWYQRAAACIVYLSDVDQFDMDLPQVRSSRWFTRGWTLQELLAPHYVVFYNSYWTRLGSRVMNSPLISAITGIHSKFLDDQSEIEHASTSEKMSWAAKRETTRSEDVAYCLMGLFDINMPLLYGEGGEKAFLRLQEEILKDSTDESIFAWDASTESDGAGMLATHPARFHNGAMIVPLKTRKNPEAVRNGGILINAPCVPSLVAGVECVVLDCSHEHYPESIRIMIQVTRRPECCRTATSYLVADDPEADVTALFFLKRPPPAPCSAELQRCEVLWPSDAFTLLEAWPGVCWNKTQGIGDLLSVPSHPLRQCTLELRRAMRLSQEAGLGGGNGEALAVLALCPKAHPKEAFILGFSAEPLLGTWRLNLTNMRGQSFPTRAEDFQYSHHWPCISRLIEDWGNGNVPFDNSCLSRIQTLSHDIVASSESLLIDRRKGIKIHIQENLREDLEFRKPEEIRASYPTVPNTHMLDIPPFEYWKPFHREPETRRQRLSREVQSGPHKALFDLKNNSEK